MYPVSAVLADKEIMLCIKPGEHGSTYVHMSLIRSSDRLSHLQIIGIFRYGGNPLGCAVAMTALDVLIDEDLVNRAQKLGELFRSKVEALKSPFIKLVRGRGLLNAVIIDESKSTKGRGAWELCLLMKSKG